MLSNISTVYIDLQRNSLSKDDKDLSRIIFTSTISQYFNISEVDADDYWRRTDMVLRSVVACLRKQWVVEYSSSMWMKLV